MRTELQTEGRKDERSDMTNLIYAFRNFTDVPKNYAFYNDRSENLTSNVICTVWCSIEY